MEKMDFVWKDVSSEPGIESRAEQAPELRRELIELGFRSAGYMERWVPWMAPKKDSAPVERAFEPSIARILTRTSWIQEVLAGPDGRALASIRMTPGGPAVNFRSVSEGGWVLDTNSGMAGGARYRRNLTGLLLNLSVGKPEPVKTKAGSGYFTLEKSAGAAELWELHRRRVREILESGGQTLRAQDAVAIYAAGAYRLHQITAAEVQASERFSRIWRWIWMVAGLLVYLVLCIVLYGLRAAGLGSTPLSIFLTAVTFIGLIGSLILGMRIFTRQIIPGTAGPPPAPLDDLLREIQAHIGPPAEGKPAA